MTVTADALNAPQREAVAYVDGPLLVLAGAGSGKTRVISEKIAHLVRRRGYPASQITAVTFTNRAAREMAERVRSTLGRDASEGLRVCTFHRLGLEIFRAEAHVLGYKSRFSILDAADSQSVLREAYRAADLGEGAVEAAHAAVSRWKGDLRTPAEARAAAEDSLERGWARVYAEYQRLLKAYNALDFDDLLLLPVTALRDDPDCRARWQGRIRYLLVDEYQDTNRAQYALLSLLAADGGRFTVVGDDDQSIYAWRGARASNLEDLARDWPSLKVVKLEQNYRCSQRILNVANRLIANNPHLFPKRLWSGSGHGDPVRVLTAHNAEDEAERIVSEIEMAHRLGRNRYGAYAILYRGNHQSRPFEQALRDRGIPYVLSGGLSFFERAEVKDVLAYLRLAVNPDDDAAFLRIVNVPRREIGAQTLEKLTAYAAGRDIGLLSAVYELGLAQAVGARAYGALSGFGRMMAELIELAEDAPAAEVVRRVLDVTDYRRWLVDNRPDPKAAERAAENLDELTGWIERLAKRDSGRLADALTQLALMDRLSREEENEPDNAVRLMTLHAAKGLEFDEVYLVGVEEDLLPHRNSPGDAGIEEERRLAYVGITRARRKLTLSYALQRSRYGQTLSPTPSRFLEELRGEDVVFEREAAPPTGEARKARDRARLAELRSLVAD